MRIKTLRSYRLYEITSRYTIIIIMRLCISTNDEDFVAVFSRKERELDRNMELITG